MSMPRHIPTNKGELELYKVLQRANVLQYYDIFISQGGDDVRQLCEAGEEEFLEIMALVGMASKPLHVRRLQKALQEWLRTPGTLLQHAPGPPMGTVGTTPVTPSAMKALMGLQMPMQHSPPQNNRIPQRYMRGPSPRKSPPGDGLHMPVVPGTGQMVPSSELPSPSPTATDNHEPHSRSGVSPVGPSVSPGGTVVSLTDTQIKSIKEAAAALVQSLPVLDLKPGQMKKSYNQEIQTILKLPVNDESRMNGIRKYSAIYGRSDSKRKCEKPMTLHEISVNEASAQLCHLVPELLTRRDELFPLARQVVRNSGNQYLRCSSDIDDNVKIKRMKTENGVDEESSLVNSDLDHMQQEIFSDIVRDLATLDQELDKIRVGLDLAKTNGDLMAEQGLLQELNGLVVRRRQLTDQQNVLLNSSKKYSQTKQNTDDSDTSHSLVSSPRDSNPEDQCDRELDLSLNNKSQNNDNSPNHKQSQETFPMNHKQSQNNNQFDRVLIGEGLRIAQKLMTSQNGQTEEKESESATKYERHSPSQTNCNING